MDQVESYFISYAPIIIVVLAFIFKNKIFVTPEQMLLMKEEIRKEVKQEYATKEIANEIKDDIRDIKRDLHDISNVLMKNTAEYDKNLKI